jgi:hypothetical protein
MGDMRRAMNDSLKNIVVPVLRKSGFKGTFPHFYRDTNGHVDLLTFQFNREGGSFVVEISYAEPGRENVYIYKETEVSKLRVSQTSKRFRLGARSTHSDNWFSFEPAGIFKRQPDPDPISFKVAALIEEQALPWWDGNRGRQNL